jgi:hypothetical protein
MVSAPRSPIIEVVPQVGSGGRSSTEADEILANKTPYFPLKSVRIGDKNLNIKLPQHESLYNNTVI